MAGISGPNIPVAPNLIEVLGNYENAGVRVGPGRAALDVLASSIAPHLQIGHLTNTAPAEGSAAIDIVPSTVLPGGIATAPLARLALSESIEVGSMEFYTPYTFFHTRVAGGKGGRNTMNVQLDVIGVGNLTDMLNPLISIGRLHSGAAGMMFGGNSYCWIDSGVDPSSQGTGWEIDTDIRAPTIASKIGLTIADIATSVGHGTVYDTAIMIGNQPGAVGYQNGIQFGYNGTDMKGVASTGGLIESLGEVYYQGIDFSRTTFAAFAWKSKGLQIDPSGNLEIGSITAAGSPFIDWHSSGNNVDYDVRMYAQGGDASAGNGSLIVAAAGMTVNGPINTLGSQILVNGTKVVGPQSSGWSAMTGATDKATVFDTSSVTLVQLASRVNALQAALTTHGLMGA